jgi:hypothetical protein
MLRRIALWGPSLIAALLLGTYIWVHRPFAVDETELVQVPLNADDPELDQVGQLRYLGGLDIPRMERNIGGLSGLRWDAESGQLLAITDDARWVWLALHEENETLVGLRNVASGMLFDRNGEWLSGKANGDSESLTRNDDGGWLVSFERDHRIWSYPSHLLNRPEPSQWDPRATLGALEDNAGIEAMATTREGAGLICAERAVRGDAANCMLDREGNGEFVPFAAYPPAAIASRGAVPTDADALSDGTFLILFRSYSPAEGNTAAIIAYAPNGTRRELATLRPPLTVDNFEGLAVREEGDRTFLYIVSDDNFSGNQRTLLMKFEILGTKQVGGG